MDIRTDDPVTYKTINLALERVATSRQIPGDFIADCHFESTVTEETKTMFLQLWRRVASDNLAEIRYPKTWWDAVKQRFAPKWFLKRWPVMEVVWTAKSFYPLVRIPEWPHSIQVFRMEGLAVGEGGPA